MSITSKQSINTSSSIKEPVLDYKPIYKVNHVVNGSVDIIYVFNGKNNENEDQEELFKRIFTDEENKKIKDTNITIKFSEQQIHYDDSIGTIKIKIVTELKNTISLDEIYLYCQQIETLNSVAVYQSLTQNKKIELTKIRMDQFISNIVSDINGVAIKMPSDKEVYTFDDILEMKLDNNKYIIKKVLGQKFFIVENEYPFICDPYDVKEYDAFFEKNARKSLTTLNSHLLLNSGEIINNNIYLCTAKDVLEFVSKNGVSEETTIKIYYPFLYNKNINDLEDLQAESEKLIENNKKVINDKTIDVFKTVDMFYDVYALRKSNLNYQNKGIKYIKAIIKPDFYVKIPLEIIFKIVHATQNNPLIKFNPSTRQENIYRFYTDKIATDGRKIPYLNKASIFKLIKNIGRNKSVAVYIEIPDGNKYQSLICEFDENGFITVTSEFKDVISEKEIDKIFRDAINPIIEEITNLLEQSGYKLKLFNSLFDDNIEIKQLTYETKIAITKPLDLESFKGCISSVFTNESSIYKGGIFLRFKRVSNFNKVTSLEAFILEKSGQGYRGYEIIESLLENFKNDLTREEAVELVRKIANEIQVERGVRKSDIKIKDNPGFKTTITIDQETGVIAISVENINDINYLTTIPIYLDTMVRLTQDKTSTNYPIQYINSLCYTGEKEDVIVPDIISSSETSASENEIPSLENEDDEIEYSKYKTTFGIPEKPKGAFSLFYDEDEDEDVSDFEGDVEIDKTGGKTRDDSESSITSENSSSSSEKNTYNGVTIPAGISSSSEQSITSSPESIPTLAVKDKTPESESEQSITSAVSSPESIPTLDVKDKTPESESEQSVTSSPESIPTLAVKEQEPIQAQERSLSSSVEPIVSNINKQLKSDSESDIGSEDDDSDTDEVRNIDGMKLNKPYYFQTLIEKKDPILILKEDTPQYNAYSRTCSSDKRRQPVILTDNQLSKINKELPGFLKEEDVIKYGSNPKNKFNYVCPKYWCLKNNTIIDPKDLKEITGKNGKKELIHPTCGKVLPRKGIDSKKVKPGYYIYEFYGDDENKRYPGFQTDKHPNGFCLPCCFDKYNTEGRIKAKEYCYKEENKDKDKAKKEDEVQEEDEYIKGPDKFPLESGRWGYLPVEMQKFFHEANADCQISKQNSSIKQNHACLLRHGVEVNKNQSFIACISDAIFFGKRIVDSDNKLTNKVSKVLSIKEMRERIAKSISIDTFIKYQNGNLVADFHDPSKKVDITKYKTSKLFSKINPENSEENIYFTKVVSAFENFKDFLGDDDALIDHTYLWDIISMPNKYLFPTGVNLVIFQLPHDDITNNVQLLCPTNHYSNEFYEARKPTIILMKEDGFYEPIYSYTNNNKKLIVAKEFKEYDPQLSKTIRAIFKEIIKPFFNLICRPLESMPNVYKAKRSLLLYNLIQKLDKYDYIIIKLVMNFNNKVIGVVAEEPSVLKKQGFIPCYPSALDEDLKKDLDYVFMTDLTLWNTYKDTVQFLNRLEKRSKKRKAETDIPCKPMFKIIEDEMVVGILTETNQFIQISQPIPESEINEEINLPSIKDENYIFNSKSKPMVASDTKITTQTEVDDVRVDYIKKIRLETNFYNVFRNTIRILINDYENIKIREKIENEINKQYIIYSEKLKNVDRFLRELVKDKMQFIGDEKYYKLINEVSTCVVKNKDSCVSTPNLCAVTENGKCNLILPEKNLITGKINETIYYGRMTDELIRYNRIKSFMFQPQTYLSFGNIGYNLRDNEIIMIQSSLTQEYFETLVPSVTNKYIKYNSYDEAEPIITQVYENVIPSLDHAIGKNNEKVCNKPTKNKITSSIWKKCFPENYNEIEYGKLNSCTFSFIIDLIERKTGNKLTINQVKNELYEEYKKYLENHKNKIVDILIIEGKKTLGDQVHTDSLSFASFIYTDNYFLTTLDLWILVQKYKIPTIFICQKFILQTKYEKHEFVGYGDENDNFAFILIPAYRAENIPNFKLIESNDKDVFISLNKLNDECVEKIKEETKNKISIEEYIENFKKPIATKYEKKKPTRLQIESDSDEIVPIKRKKNQVIEETEPISPEEFILKPNKKQTKKKVVLKGNPKTKKNIKNKKLLIVESSSTENI